MRRAVALCGCILVAAACAAGGPSLSNERPHLGVSNGTTLAVTLVVNGQTVATFEPGEPGPELDRISLPALPWTVEARSPAGRILTTMTVEPGDARSTTRPGGQVDMAGKMGRVDLSCGRLTIWAGDFQPSGPAPASPAGSPGDCLP